MTFTALSFLSNISDLPTRLKFNIRRLYLSVKRGYCQNSLVPMDLLKIDIHVERFKTCYKQFITLNIYRVPSTSRIDGLLGADISNSSKEYCLLGPTRLKSNSGHVIMMEKLLLKSKYSTRKKTCCDSLTYNQYV